MMSRGAAFAAWTPLFAAFLATACAGGDRSRSPTCGMALLIAPSLIQEQLKRPPFVLTETPRGLPGSLPVRVAGTTQPNTVLVTYAKGALTMDFQGTGFPAASVSDSSVYALLVVDDSTQRAQGVLVYESRRPPPEYPSIGQLVAGDRSIPLYGVRVEWVNVSNPRCPLFGAPSPASPGSASQE